MLKVDLHLHTAEDPADYILHDAHQLIDRAAGLGFDALAITLHDRQLADPRVFAYARERRIVLLPGIERSIQGRHVVLINFPQSSEQIRTFDDLARPESAHPRHRHRPPPVLPAPHQPDVAPRGPAGAVRCGRMELLLDRRAQFQRPGGPLGRGARQADRRQFRPTRPAPARPHVLAGRSPSRTPTPSARRFATAGCRSRPLRFQRRELARVLMGMGWRDMKPPARLPAAGSSSASRPSCLIPSPDVRKPR